MHTFLGKIIVDEYKKTDPEEQQIWVSSVLRLILKYVAPYFQLRSDIELIENKHSIVIQEKSQQRKNNLRLNINKHNS